MTLSLPWRSLLALAGLSALVGCGSSGGYRASDACTIALTGALTERYNCCALTFENRGQATFDVTVVHLPSNGFSSGFTLAGGATFSARSCGAADLDFTSLSASQPGVFDGPIWSLGAAGGAPLFALALTRGRDGA